MKIRWKMHIPLGLDRSLKKRDHRGSDYISSYPRSCLGCKTIFCENRFLAGTAETAEEKNENMGCHEGLEFENDLRKILESDSGSLKSLRKNI